MKILMILLSLFTLVIAQSKDLEKVSLQLMWLDQFQFAGYYMAKEKGFYEKEGLDVDIKKFTYSTNVVDEVLDKKATFGVGRSSLIQHHADGKKLVLLSAIFQSSPFVLIALKDSNINSIDDFTNRTLMLTKDALETASIHAMINSYKIDEKQLSFKRHTFDLEELIDSRVDLYASYLSNEPYTLKQKGIDYTIFSPKDEGFDFYSDLLFTSDYEVQKNPIKVKKFKEASLKGWRYAFENIDESVEFIYKNHNPQKKSKEAIYFEAKTLKALAYINNIKLGDINKEKISRIFDVYKLMGLAKGSLNLQSLIFSPTYTLLTQDEKEYLKSKEVINICVLENSLPYSAIKDGKYIGIGSQILALTKNKIDITYNLVETKKWVDAFKKGSNEECDLLPIAAKTPSREALFNFTSPYHHEHLTIVTDKKNNYILDFNTVMDKSFSIVKGQSFIEELRTQFPQINLTTVNSTKEGIEGVKKGKYYGHIDLLISSAYWLKHIKNADSLHIAGQFEHKVNVSFGIKKDDKILLNIFEKLSNHIEQDKIQQLLDNWVSINYSHHVRFAYTKELIILFLLVVSAFFYRQHLLKNKNRELETLQEKLVILNHSLESEVLKANKDLHKAQEMANIGSWILDVDTNELKWSLQTYKIFELDSSQKYDSLYDKFLDGVHPEDRLMLEATYAKSLHDKKSYDLKHRLLMKDGSVKYVLEHCETSYDENSHPLRSYGTIQDITLQTVAKMELEKKDLYLLQQSRLAQMGEMLSMIAHQWRQPLASISTAQINMKVVMDLEKYDLDNKNEREEFLQYFQNKLQKIELYTQNLSKTITDFSDFYRPNKKSEILIFDDIIKKAYTMVDDILKTNSIEVTFDLHTECKINAHENELMQVIINLLTNAKDQFVEKNTLKPKIKIRSHLKKDDIYLEVIDNAGGIDKSIIGKLFDPYFSTKLERNGTGLGLYLSKIIIKDYHHGDIYAKNNRNGAIFIIKIPKDRSKQCLNI